MSGRIKLFIRSSGVAAPTAEVKAVVIEAIEKSEPVRQAQEAQKKLPEEEWKSLEVEATKPEKEDLSKVGQELKKQYEAVTAKVEASGSEEEKTQLLEQKANVAEVFPAVGLQEPERFAVGTQARPTEPSSVVRTSHATGIASVPNTSKGSTASPTIVSRVPILPAATTVGTPTSLSTPVVTASIAPTPTPTPAPAPAPAASSLSTATPTGPAAPPETKVPPNIPSESEPKEEPQEPATEPISIPSGGPPPAPPLPPAPALSPAPKLPSEPENKASSSPNPTPVTRSKSVVPDSPSKAFDAADLAAQKKTLKKGTSPPRPEDTSIGGLLSSRLVGKWANVRKGEEDDDADEDPETNTEWGEEAEVDFQSLAVFYRKSLSSWRRNRPHQHTKKSTGS